MATEAVRRVNEQRDQTGLTYARKAMIRCGLSLDITGEWHKNNSIAIFKSSLKNIVNISKVLLYRIWIRMMTTPRCAIKPQQTTSAVFRVIRRFILRNITTININVKL
jgi:hypothetical protein